ncbi:MAG TPA: HAMP domain-containing sensor histidine kinase [Gemmatimonadales bacterium]
MVSPADSTVQPPGAGEEGEDPWARLDAPPPAHEAGWSALVGVARAVPAGHSEARQGVVSAAQLELPVVRLCTAVRDALSGRRPTLAESQSLVPLRPLLDALRGGFLDASDTLAAGGAGADVVPVLRAIEQVQEALSDDSAQRLAGRLAEGDAMNLVVEVAHDMRSPLSSILFLVERIRRGQSGPVTPVQERQLGLMYSAAFGLGTLASDVMELARGGDRLVSHRPIAFSVQEIVQAVRDVVQPMAEEKRLELVFGSLDPDWRVGYPQALNRVLLNLVTNALKFTNEGRVTVTPRAVGRERVEFVVEDTGRGIPPHVMATLFDAFRRRQSIGDYAFSSAGLGLSICRKLIAAMGSELRVETELERGTRFRFELELPPAPRY